MNPTRIHPTHHHHDEPSNVKLQHILEHDHPTNTHQTELDIFTYLNLEFKINEVLINENQHLHTVFVPTEHKSHKHKVIFMTHGFGGSSLMYFPVIKTLLQHGNVVLWQLRGMGISRKLPKYRIPLQQTEQFFLHPIELMLKYYYKYKEISFVSHSFGGYLTLLYLLKYKSFHSRVKEVVLLSPVGITSKEQDYKSKVNNFSDCLHVVGNKISWAFGVTYKSPFRCLCVCLKDKVFANAVKGCGFDQKEEVLMKELLIAMVESTDGSEKVFFNYFEPRVMPKFPIEPIFADAPGVKLKIFYGGDEDWVDKKGAQRLQTKYPSKIDLTIVKQCGHNFPFFPQVLKKLLQEVFSKEHHNEHKNHQMRNEEKLLVEDLMNLDNVENREGEYIGEMGNQIMNKDYSFG